MYDQKVNTCNQKKVKIQYMQLIVCLNPNFSAKHWYIPQKFWEKKNKKNKKSVSLNDHVEDVLNHGKIII